MANEQALADVKVLDFMWAMAGPAASRVLADCGATIVRVESTKRADVTRTLTPFLAMPPGAEDCAIQHNLNAGKLMITLDLDKPEGREIVLDLVRWADVVLDSFMAGTMRRWGFDYESLRKVKPDIIVLSSCLMGQSGPLANYAGFGNLAAAITGFYNLTGWPDRPPAGPYGAYTDYVSPRFTVAAVLAALDHKRRTGEGVYIDQSQGEASLHFLAPTILDYTSNGRVGERAGNRDRELAPNGVYPAAGEDRWVAIAVRNDEEWRNLCAAMERPDLAADARFATRAGRLEQSEKLDALVAGWTKTRDREDIERLLQARGVPASAVQNSTELVRDPQLLHRRHFVELEHPERGKTVVEGSRFTLSRTPPAVRRSAPTLGRDNQYVLEKILGYGEDKITELVVAGALQ
jgi:crotonobetainyl-CoA:carnitine CoA-transferase CaiB-like acyl-CoA transferase